MLVVRVRKEIRVTNLQAPTAALAVLRRRRTGVKTEKGQEGKEKEGPLKRGERDGKEVAEGVESEYPSCQGSKQAAARIWARATTVLYDQLVLDSRGW